VRFFLFSDQLAHRLAMNVQKLADLDCRDFSSLDGLIDTPSRRPQMLATSSAENIL
jgi:hypothetical protein